MFWYELCYDLRDVDVGGVLDVFVIGIGVGECCEIVGYLLVL